MSLDSLKIAETHRSRDGSNDNIAYNLTETIFCMLLWERTVDCTIKESGLNLPHDA